MLLRLYLLLPLALIANAPAVGQTSIRTETIRPPAPVQPAAGKFKSDGRVIVPAASSAAPEIIGDLARLPPAVAQTRDRMLAAARSGNVHSLAAVALMNETVF